MAGLVAQSLLTAGCAYGLGNHLALLDEHQVMNARKWGWITQLLSIQAIGFGKLAVIAFLLRIEERTYKKRVWFLYFVGFSNVIININQTTLMGTVCWPLVKLWDPAVRGNCPPYNIVRTNYVGYFQGGMLIKSALGIDDVLTMCRLVRNQRCRSRYLSCYRIPSSEGIDKGQGLAVCPYGRRCTVGLSRKSFHYAVFLADETFPLNRAGICSAVKTYNIKLIGVSKDNTCELMFLFKYTPVWPSTWTWSDSLKTDYEERRCRYHLNHMGVYRIMARSHPWLLSSSSRLFCAFLPTAYRRYIALSPYHTRLSTFRN